MIKKLVLRGLDMFGYQLVKREKAPQHLLRLPKRDTPLYIEFIGVSGVGKTTLFNQMCKLRKKNCDWITPQEFFQLEKPTYSDNIFTTVYQEILENKLTSIMARKYSTSNTLMLLSFFYHNLKEIALVRQNNKSYIVLFEDGLFHNFAYSLEEMYLSNESQFRSMIKNSAVIFCNSSPEIIANQILKRQRERGILHPHHKFDEFCKLVEYQENEIRNKRKQIDILRKYDIPILELDTSKSIDENNFKIAKFVCKLKKN